MKQKLLSLLALLLMMTQGAWAQIPQGALSGKFTINDSGDKVYFSQGNLQAVCTSADGDGSTPETWTWQFATNQWDNVGNVAPNTNESFDGENSVTTAGTVDRFKWVGANSGLAPYGINNNSTVADYGNVAGEALKSDWGNLAITNGGNTENLGWRTLAYAEWNYLINSRSSGSTVNGTLNARYTFATINTGGTSVNGLILFPDGVTLENSEASWGNINKNKGDTNCTTAQWTALAAKGCVFLPRSINFATSTSPNETRQYNMSISASSILFSTADRTQRSAVRLVYPVPSVTLAEGTDNSTWITEKNGESYNVTLTRTLQTGGWNTFSVPFAIGNSSAEAGHHFDGTPLVGATVKELTAASMDGGALNLTFSDAASIVAGTPYLVKVESNVENPVFKDVTIVKDPAPTTIVGVISFMPAINPTSLTANDKSVLFISGGNSLAYPSTTNNLKGFRAYFQLLGGSVEIKSYSMDFVDEEVTGIIDVTTDNGQQTTGGWYTIDGRRLEGEPTEKGVYIQNGKKVIIK